MPAEFSPRRLATGIVRQLRLPRGSRVLHVGCGDGEVVNLLRRSRQEAFGLFDGPPQERDEQSEPPQIQPTLLHQSLPFAAQSFDVVLVQQSGDYDGSLATPEACTATANLLAALKPGGTLVYCGEADFSRMKQHLAQFPGYGSHLSLGARGVLYWMLRLCGLARPGLPALKFTIGAERITRLEWHRIARKAVAHLSQSAPSTAGSPDQTAVESPAA
jgi:SAM-dependent methyltransferase